jgi:hypothetical protein
MLPIKKILFPSSFWGIFDFFFVLFDSFLKKNKGILCYNGGTSKENIQAQGTRTRLMFWEMILGKNPPVVKGVKTHKQTVTRLMGKV